MAWRFLSSSSRFRDLHMSDNQGSQVARLTRNSTRRISPLRTTLMESQDFALMWLTELLSWTQTSMNHWISRRRRQDSMTLKPMSNGWKLWMKHIAQHAWIANKSKWNQLRHRRRRITIQIKTLMARRTKQQNQIINKQMTMKAWRWSGRPREAEEDMWTCSNNRISHKLSSRRSRRWMSLRRMQTSKT